MNTHQKGESATLTVSQREGYEDLPQPLQLEELSDDARISIFNAFWRSLFQSGGSANLRMLRDVWGKHFVFPMDGWSRHPDDILRLVRDRVYNEPFNKLFDFIEYVMRHESCPDTLADEMAQAFRDSNLAYVVDTGKPPTILPATTPAEGKALVESMHTIEKAGLSTSLGHLRSAGSHINHHNWADSIRESIHAVGSTARYLAPESARSLKHALQSLDRRRHLHPALRGAFEKLYGYTSDEQGIRHSLIDGTEANVGRDEAIFMFGACASFASFLCRKYPLDSSP